MKDLKQFKELAPNYEVRIDSHENFTRTPPHYYDSLRHAFGAFFNTFHTNNAKYDYYATQCYNGIASHEEFIDEENTILTLIGFARFFELFYKDLLSKTNNELIYVWQRLSTTEVIEKISNTQNTSKKYQNSITFGNTINRFYDLVDIATTNNSSNETINKFKCIIDQFPFLMDMNTRSTLEVLNWYRNRVLHNGSRLPSLYLLVKRQL